MAVFRPAGRRLWRAIRHRRAWVRSKIVYHRGPKTLVGAREPIFICGTGGSGTRAVAALLRELDCFIGGNLNLAMDSRDMGAFQRAWLGLYLDPSRRSMLERTPEPMANALEQALIRHRSAIAHPGALWAVKNPRSILLLPYLRARFPGMCVIHVVRDGRDMAFASNKKQFENFGHLLIPDQDNCGPLPVRLARFWSVTNIQAASLGAGLMAGHYLRVRLEDLCRDPAGSAAALASWIGNDEPDLAAAASVIRRPPSLGRWRAEDAEVIAEIESAGGLGLEAFGYFDDSHRESAAITPERPG